MVNETRHSADDVDLQRTIDEYIRCAQPPPPEILELEFIYEALAHPRRRYTVYSLLSSTRWTLSDLATKLVAWERDIPETAVTGSARDQMYVSLYHVHIPKLVDLDIVQYDGHGDEVLVPAENAVQVLAVLEGAGASLDTAQEEHARGS